MAFDGYEGPRAWLEVDTSHVIIGDKITTGIIIIIKHIFSVYFVFNFVLKN